jgi:hypothetical protein
VLRRLLATACGDEQRENDREGDRAAAIHASAKVM